MKKLLKKAEKEGILNTNSGKDYTRGCPVCISQPCWCFNKNWSDTLSTEK